MRDGIYKGLKMGRGWRSLLKHCEREADRGPRAQQAAVSALDRDLRRNVQAATLRGLRSIANDMSRFLPGLSPHDPRSSSDTPVNASPLEDTVWRHFRRVLSEGGQGDDAVRRAVRDALGEWKERCIRQVQEQCLSHPSRNTQKILAAAQDALNAANCDEISRRFVSGEKISKMARKQIDLDEDLVGPKK